MNLNPKALGLAIESPIIEEYFHYKQAFFFNKRLASD